MNNPLLDVFTPSEASKLWNVPLGTIKTCLTWNHNYPPKFHVSEIRKSGKARLISRTGMERVFGEQPNKEEWLKGMRDYEA